VHRIGRTGRAGNTGEAVSLVCVDETGLLQGIERLLKRRLPTLVIPEFTPDPRIPAEPIINGRSANGRSQRPPNQARPNPGAPRQEGRRKPGARTQGSGRAQGSHGNR